MEPIDFEIAKRDFLQSEGIYSMPVINIIPIGDSATCSVSADGTVSFPKSIIEQVGWRATRKIAVSYIPEPLVLLLRPAELNRPGFTLSYNDHARKGLDKPGGRLSCSKFTKEILRPRLALPARGIAPIILKNGQTQLALMLQLPTWITESFSMAGCQNIPSGIKGVYQLISSEEEILRIGEGTIQTRIKEHLKDERLARMASAIRYCVLADKEETSTIEKVLIAQYEAEYGELPSFNRIRA